MGASQIQGPKNKEYVNPSLSPTNPINILSISCLRNIIILRKLNLGYFDLMTRYFVLIIIKNIIVRLHLSQGSGKLLSRTARCLHVPGKHTLGHYNLLSALPIIIVYGLRVSVPSVRNYCYRDSLSQTCRFQLAMSCAQMRHCCGAKGATEQFFCSDIFWEINTAELIQKIRVRY